MTAYASIYKARKATGYKFELLIHRVPSIAGDSVTAAYYYQTKHEAIKAAAILGAKAWNY